MKQVSFLARMLGGVSLLLGVSCDNDENMLVSVVDDSTAVAGLAKETIII